MFKQIHEYLHDLTPERPEVMAEMEAYARENRFPIIGPLVGRFLYQMASVTKTKNIFELGSGFGYSAYWFSMAMGDDGHITMTDGDPNNRDRAQDYLRRAEVESKTDFIVGDAVTALREVGGQYDIILNDIDKHGYPSTIDPVADHLRPGGLFITDNTIWSGRVLDKKPDKTTQGVIDFNKMIYNDSRFFCTLIPLRDGLTIAMRL